MVAKSSPPGGVRKVRGGVRTRPAMRQAPTPGQVEETPGDPFSTLAHGEEGPSAPWSRIKYTVTLSGKQYYWHRDLKHPVIVRNP
jgi:hypothetical protein